MRAGKLKTRRYKTRRGGGRWALAALVLLAGIGAAIYFLQSEGISLWPAPAPTLTPEESAADARTLTLPAQTWYTLQLGVFEQSASARELADSFRARGAAGYVDAREHYRVLAAAYPSRSDAQAVQTQLRALHGVDAYVYEISRGEVTMKVTGQKAQLSALSDAYGAVDQAAERLYALSSALDKREMELADILAALKSEKATASALARRLQTLFGENPHEAVGRLITLLEELAAALEKAEDQGSAALSAQIKYCQLLCVARMAEYASALAP